MFHGKPPSLHMGMLYNARTAAERTLHAMKEKLLFYVNRIREGRLREMAQEIRWIYGYARKYWWIMIAYTLLGMTGTVTSLVTSFVSKDLVDMITGFQSGAILRQFLIMIALGIGTTLLSQASGYVSSYLGMKVDAEIKSDIFSKILVTDWESLTNYHTGDLLVRWSSDASVISNSILSFVPNLIIYVFQFISAFAIVISHDASFAIFAFLGMPFSLLLSKTLLGRMVNNNKRSAEMGARMSGFNQETFSNIQTIKAFDLIPLYISKLKQLQKDVINMRLEFQRMSMGTSLLMSTVSMLVSYASYGWGIYRVFSGKISYGTMTMFLSLSGTLTGTLHNLTSLVPSTISMTTSARRLMDIVEMPREDFSNDDSVLAFKDRSADKGISLRVDHVSYAYQNGNQVFRDASFHACPHEVIALVGSSGGGKTTMLRLVLSLLTSQAGNAYLYSGGSDETDRVPLTPSTRKLFSYVPQGNTMFTGTIAENMRNVKPDATEEEIIDVLKQACAWEFVEKLPEGIHSKIKERGGGFSEGQAQRLSIARSLLRKSPILLLDEATSALDMKTERQLLNNVMTDSYPRTCIVTTHRPSVLALCTRVYRIGDGDCVLMTEEEIDQMISLR